MDIVEISYIDTAELDGYIRESLKRWDETKSNFGNIVTIVSRRVWKDETSTKAAYYCKVNDLTALMIYVNYDELEMIGIIEIEHLGASSEAAKQELKEIMIEVVGNFDPSLAALPFGVKCPHCGARYVYKIRTGIVNCQNCAKPFDLEYQDEIPIVESDKRKEDIRESGSRYIALERSKIVHCKWCGTPESTNWIHGNFGRMYCSTDCVYADSVEINSIASLCIFVILLILFVPILAHLGITSSGLLLPISIIAILPLIFIFIAFRGISIRNTKPKDSRAPR